MSLLALSTSCAEPQPERTLLDKALGGVLFGLIILCLSINGRKLDCFGYGLIAYHASTLKLYAPQFRQVSWLGWSLAGLSLSNQSAAAPAFIGILDCLLVWMVIGAIKELLHRLGYYELESRGNTIRISYVVLDGLGICLKQAGIAGAQSPALVILALLEFIVYIKLLCFISNVRREVRPTSQSTNASRPLSRTVVWCGVAIASLLLVFALIELATSWGMPRVSSTLSLAEHGYSYGHSTRMAGSALTLVIFISANFVMFGVLYLRRQFALMHLCLGILLSGTLAAIASNGTNAPNTITIDFRSSGSSETINPRLLGFSAELKNKVAEDPVLSRAVQRIVISRENNGMRCVVSINPELKDFSYAAEAIKEFSKDVLKQDLASTPRR